jgi:hypothetical protein
MQREDAFGAGPSGFDIRALECAKCDHAHIVTVATGLVSDSRSLHARAIDALEEAQAMSPGAQRTEGLKKAGLLRRTAGNQGVMSAKRGKPRKVISWLKQQLAARFERLGAWQPTEIEQIR